MIPNKHGSDPSTWEMEAKGSGYQSHPWLQASSNPALAKWDTVSTTTTTTKNQPIYIYSYVYRYMTQYKITKYYRCYAFMREIDIE